MRLIRKLFSRFGYVKLNEIDVVLGEDGKPRDWAQVLPTYSFMVPNWQAADQMATLPPISEPYPAMSFDPPYGLAEGSAATELPIRKPSAEPSYYDEGMTTIAEETS